jgi:GTPase SAR1 family protein
LAFDLTRKVTLENTEKWFNELKSHADPNIVILLVGNKTDLTELRVNPLLIMAKAITKEEAASYAEKKNCAYIETSALTSENVQ